MLLAHTMLRARLTPTSALPKLTPFLRPALFSSLLALAASGFACSSTDSPTPASAGQGPGASGAPPAVAGSPAGGAGPGSAGAGASGGTIGAAGSGSGTAGAPATAGSGSSVAGGGSVAGASGSNSGAAGGGSTGPTHWVGTWTASPYATASDGQPPAALANSVLRQITHASLGGNQIRVQFSNKEGKAALTIKAAHVALCKATPLVRRQHRCHDG